MKGYGGGGELIGSINKIIQAQILKKFLILVFIILSIKACPNIFS